eukprot:TRINITY_DN6138_c0_g1_i1.p1 TRINITY_DN6138_c0_g1~~TRINITY_DN6138_c0_g1_i1.p1  ORF type:complete len:725 (-),score=193.83 TRINITY_DN6138_c0_g1_i1:220-2394(-)
MKTPIILLLTLLGELQSAELDLSQWTRAGKQFGGNEEGGVALGLVSALQKWANSLESQTSTLRSEVLGLKNSNIQLIEEMQQIKSQNINLKNEVSQANERTINLKNIYQKSSNQFDELKKENIELKTQLQQHASVLKTQQEKIQNNNNEITSLKTELSSTSASLTSLQGKLSEVMKSNSILSSHVEKINSTITDEHNMQMNTVKGLERLGDSMASLKGEMMGDNHEGTMKTLKEKTEKLEKQVKSVSAKQLTTVQDVTRNTGRLNKVELDIKKINNNVANVVKEQDKTKQESEKKLGAVNKLAGEIRSDVDTLATTLTTTRNAVAEVLTKMSSLEAQGTASRSSSDVASTVNTLKTNVIGLGNYINSINREVNSLAGRTKDSIENINQQVVELTANVNSIETELSSTKKSNANLKNEFSSGDFVASTLRTDVAGLSTKLYTLKTSVFEMTSELSGVKSGLKTLNSDVKTINTNIQSISNKILVNEQTSKNTKSDLSTLRSGLSGLTNSIFSVKSQIKSIENIDSKIAELSKNITGVTDVVSVTRSEFSKIKPEVDLIATDITTIRNGMSRMTKAVQSIADPPRFSCGVTGDEIKVSGVITYDECTVNREKMMNAGTGHATVPVDGDYLLSFTANMVSANSQAIWCALYKQSPGDEGWQVLGMINNYQRDAGEEDDRDSGSLSILATLKEGDQVWVEWRGYGESFLYSNPYKLISFTGYMVTSTS